MKRWWIPLLTGGHNHIWDAATGSCSECGQPHAHKRWEDGRCLTCGYGCPHEHWLQSSNLDYEHECSVCHDTEVHERSVLHATKEQCYTCNKCKYTKTKHWFNGTATCEDCKFVCNHSYGMQYYPAIGFPTDHHCSLCLMHFAHKLKEKNEFFCKKCEECLAWEAHEFNGNSTCTKCQYVCTHTHGSAHGLCVICGHVECKHTNSDKDKQGQEVCRECKAVLRRTDEQFFVRNGAYMGGYGHADPVNDMRVYKGWRDMRQVKHSEETVSETTTRGSTGLFLVALNITTPTNYGGEYKYTVQGLAFTDDPENLGINLDLLRGDGKYIKSFKQYNLDNSEHSSETGSYTSGDWPKIEGVDQDKLISGTV